MANADALRRKIERTARTAVTAAGLDVRRDLRKVASDPGEMPFNTDHLANSIQTQVAGTLFRPAIRVFTDDEHGDFREFGTRPHTIRAKPGSALRFVVNGQEVFAKSVNHPGNAADPWFFPIVEQWPTYIATQFRRLAR